MWHNPFGHRPKPAAQPDLAAQPTTPWPPVALVRLEQAQPQVSVPEFGLRLTLLGLEDSRCPLGAQCVWTGKAVLRLEVLFAGHPPEAIALSDLHLHAPDQRRFWDLHGHRLEWGSLLPLPGYLSPQAPWATVLVRPLSPHERA